LTDVKANITTDPAVLSGLQSPASGLSLSWDSINKHASTDIDANGTADVSFQCVGLRRRVARTGVLFVLVQIDQQTIADSPVGGAACPPSHCYVYASYFNEPVVQKGAGTGGTRYYFHRNQQYSNTGKYGNCYRQPSEPKQSTRSSIRFSTKVTAKRFQSLLAHRNQ
jgi:hypothetical protein